MEHLDHALRWYVGASYTQIIPYFKEFSVQKEATHSTIQTIGIALLLSIVFTWPIAFSTDINISRQFDVYTLVWLLDASGYIENGQFSMNNFPFGQNIGQMDSWLALIIGWLNHSILPTWILLNWMTIGANTLSILGAHTLAREFGISWKSSWIAGILFALGGLNLIALLEGSWYLLGVGWIPYIGVLCKRYENNPSWKLSLGITTLWTGALLTSAYIGLCATLFLGMYIFLFREQKQSFTEDVSGKPLSNFFSTLRAWKFPVLGCGLVGMAYTAFFLYLNAQSRFLDGLGHADNWQHYGSGNLENFLFWTPNTDIVQHSLAPMTSIFVVATLCFAPILLFGWKWKPWWITAIISTVLAFGFTMGFGEEDMQIQWVLYPFAKSTWLSFLHFPMRLQWVSSLCAGVLLAKIADRYDNYRTHTSTVLIAFALIDAFVVQGTIFRKANTPNVTPSVYSSVYSEGALLELYPIFEGHTGIERLYVKNTLCSYQSTHLRPILMSCIGTSTVDSIDWWFRSLFFADILDKQEIDWKSTFSQLGIGTVMMHPNWFSNQDNEILFSTLTQQLGEAQLTGTTSQHPMLGEMVFMWHIPEPETDTEILQGNYRDFFQQHEIPLDFLE